MGAGDAGNERRHELRRQLLYIILIAGTLVFLYIFHGANRYAMMASSVERMSFKQKKYRASLISELQIPFEDCNISNIYRMGTPNFFTLRKKHTHNITLWILLDNTRGNNLLFERYYRVRCHIFGAFQNVRISPDTSILQKRIMPGDVAIIPLTTQIRIKKGRRRLRRRIPPQLVELNKWRWYNNRNQVRIGVLHYVDFEIDTVDNQQKDTNMDMDMGMEMNLEMPNVQFFPMLPKMPASCVPTSPLLPPRGTTCSCGEKDMALASKRKYVYAVHAQYQYRNSNHETEKMKAEIRKRIERNSIGRISPSDDLNDAMFAIIPCRPPVSRVLRGVYEAITYGAIPIVDNCSSINNTNTTNRFMRAHKDAVGFISDNFMDSEDSEAPDLKKIDIMQENLLQEWYTYSKLLAVNVLKTATNNTRDLS